MAHYSVHIGTVQRSKGENAIATAAYISRSKLTLYTKDKETGITSDHVWDYSKKGGLGFSKIYAPDDSPEWVFDRERLWNKAELAENRVDGVPAGKIMLALPKELSEEQNIALLEDIVSELVKLGMIVDANIHNDKEDNPHAHIQHTLRELELDRYNELNLSRLKRRDWMGPGWVRMTREMIADKINKHYKINGFDLSVTHKSYKELGIDLEPGRHEGPARNIKNAELVEVNREIAKGNADKIKECPTIILDVIGQNRPVFTKEHIAVELEKRLHAGINFDKIDDIESLQNELSSTFTSLYSQILASPELSLVTESDLKGRTLYTTTKRLRLENRYIDTVRELHKRSNHSLGLTDSDLDHLSTTEKLGEKAREFSGKLVDHINQTAKSFGAKGALLDKPKQNVALSDEQRKAVLNILNGGDISVLEGIPGAGKTTAMREIVRQYRKQGRKVIGVAPSSSASLELAKATGIECRNGSQWRKKWLKQQNKEFELVLRGDYYREDRYKDNDPCLTNKHVMIIDESSMGELANMDYLLSEAKKAGAKVLLVGDNNQLSAVGWAGALAKAIDICGSERLEESRRQRNPEHRKATKLLAEYNVRAALDIYWKEGAIIVAENESEANEIAARNFVDRYIKNADFGTKDNLVATRSIAMCVCTNKTRHLLNERSRQLLREAGILKGKEYSLLVGSVKQDDGKYKNHYLRLQRGEQIVFNRNENYLGESGTFNGELGTVLRVHGASSDPSKGDSLGRVDILVNKANGKQEKITLDLRELSEKRHFHEDIVIDYGYAVTANKIQGGSIEGNGARIEKGGGYNLFNVLATRHKDSVEFVTDKETLKDIYYESLDKDSNAARNRFELDEQDEEALLKGALAKLVSKRVDTSFAVDYRTLGRTEQDELLKNYLDKSEEAISTIRKITAWQASELRRTGLKPQMLDHKELWKKFKQERQERAKAAYSIVKAPYLEFKDRLLQLNMNYATLEKHASQLKNGQKSEKSNDLDKVHIYQRESILHEQEFYKGLVDSINFAGTAFVSDADIKKHHNQIVLHIADTHTEIEGKSQEIKQLLEESVELQNAIDTESHYRGKLMPEYLNRIYHTFDGTKQDAGSEALGEYERLVEKYGAEEATSKILKDPTLLGTLKGYGLGKIFGFSNKRKDAIELIRNLGKQLDAYNRSGEMLAEYKAQYKEANYAGKIELLNTEIENLRKLLPSDLDREFLDAVGANLNNNSSNGQEYKWKDLQDSQLFETVSFYKYEQQHEEILETASDDKATFRKNKSNGASKAGFREKSSKPSLKFDDVRAALNSSIVSSFFKDHAHLVNPDGKIVEKGSSISAGSLNMSLEQSKLGVWNRFSDGSSGDIFSFAVEAKGVSNSEALEIVASYAGITPSTSIAYKEDRSIKTGNKKKPEHIKDAASQKQEQSQKNSWEPVKVIPADAPEFKATRDLAFLSEKGSKVTGVYSYRNEDGNILGHTARIMDGEGKKQVLPVAYCRNAPKDKSRWQLKGFTDQGNKPIYGLEKLYEAEHITKPVLIVEGEKTADKAQELLPEYNVISWMGGAGGISKVDWSHLKEKEAVIWPDNDKPGIEAASKICEHIDQHNGFTGMVKIVDTGSLPLPEKWDLADELPESLRGTDARKLIDGHGKLQDGSTCLREFDNSLLLVSNRRTLASFDFLVSKGRLDVSENEYIFKSIYKESLAAIAASRGKDLSKDESFVDTIRELQSLYSKRVADYDQSKEQQTASSKEEQLVQELVRHTSLLHEIKLGTNDLPKTHKEQITDTAKEIVSSLKQFKDADREYTGEQMLTAVSGKKWLDKLEHRNEERVTTVREQINMQRDEQIQVKEGLKAFSNSCKGNTLPQELFKNLLEEQRYLASLEGTIQYPECHGKRVNSAIVTAKNQIEDGTLGKLEKALEANLKQGIRSNREIVTFLQKGSVSLASKNQSSSHDLATITGHLEDWAKQERKNRLEIVRYRIETIKKLGVQVDEDQLVGEIKSMAPEARNRHIDDKIAEAARVYTDPIIQGHRLEKSKASNLSELMDAMKSEQNSLHELYKEHKLAVYTMEQDQPKQSRELSFAITEAKEFEQLGGMNALNKLIEHTDQHGIKTSEEFFKEHKENSTSAALAYHDLQKNCHAYHKNMIDHHIELITKKGMEIKIKNHAFRDPVSYLKHIKNEHDHTHLPMIHINNQIKHFEQQRYIQNNLEKEQELQKHHEISGPCL